MGAFIVDFMVDLLGEIVGFIFKKGLNHIRYRKKTKLVKSRGGAQS